MTTVRCLYDRITITHHFRAFKIHRPTNFKKSRNVDRHISRLWNCESSYLGLDPPLVVSRGRAWAPRPEHVDDLVHGGRHEAGLISVAVPGLREGLAPLRRGRGARTAAWNIGSKFLLCCFNLRKPVTETLNPPIQNFAAWKCETFGEACTSNKGMAGLKYRSLRRYSIPKFRIRIVK